MKTNRRNFIKNVAAATTCVPLVSSGALAGTPKPTIYVVHGADVKAMLGAGIEKMGGWSAFVNQGQKATVKPNAAWTSLPEQGGNTDPVLVGACVAACKAAGASEVVVPENTVSPSKKSFGLSGIQKAVGAAGGRMYSARKGEHFREVKLPSARILKEADVAVDVLDTGCLINMPVAKSHSATVLTLSMKNWMGSVKNRKIWHMKGLDQCIADLSTAIKPDLVVVDATRIMVTGGPRGPGQIERPQQIILGKDPVAVDAYAATLFKKDPFNIKHIKMAHEMKIGCGDLSLVNVQHIKLG